jgi:hypothetical protein
MATYKVFFTDAGVPATGLSPTIPVLKRVDTQDDITPPTVYEVGGGWYTFEHEPAQAQVGYVDGTATLDAADRYIPIDLNVEDIYLDAPVAVIDTAVDAVKAKTDNLPSDPADESLIIAATDALAVLIGAVPTVTEFEARTLAAEDYTIVSDLPEAPDNTSIAAILVDTGTTIPEAMALDATVAKEATLVASMGNLETGLVVADGLNSIISFKTDLASAVDSYCIGSFVKFTSGNVINQVKKISGYGGTSKLMLVTSGFTAIPDTGASFVIINQ